MEVAKETVMETIESWNIEPKERVIEFIEKYGLPQEMTHKRAIWHNNGTWRRSMIVNELIPHNYPVPHEDFLYQVIDYKVPLEKVSDILAFDGSAIVDPPNMAVEIIKGEKTIHEAREFMADSMVNQKNKEYLTELQFEPMSEQEARQPDMKFEL